VHVVSYSLQVKAVRPKRGTEGIFIFKFAPCSAIFLKKLNIFSSKLNFFLNCFNKLILKINFKKYYFNIFLNKITLKTNFRRTKIKSFSCCLPLKQNNNSYSAAKINAENVSAPRNDDDKGTSWVLAVVIWDYWSVWKGGTFQKTIVKK
jgi:hypothetical protein